MKLSTPNFTSAVAAALFAVCAGAASAQTTATTDPVGFFTISIRGASDNIISIPMTQAFVFAGTVQSFTANTITVTSGGQSPAWTTNQYQFNQSTQPQTYLLEVTSGALKGIYYTITSNTLDTLTLDTQGDDLTNHPPLGSLAANDSVRIRPHWRIKDIFESAGAPLIDPRTNALVAKDDILIPNYSAVGINKAPNVTIYYSNVSGNVGWRAVGQGSAPYDTFVIEPNTAVILRRRNVNPLSLVTVGGVSTVRSVSFVAGGNGTSSNDTYVSINHAAPVSLDNSGLRIADQTNSVIKDSSSDLNPGDRVLAFNPNATGTNQAPPVTYYYRAGQGWKQVGGGLVGSTAFLQPGTAYIIRKAAANAGTDWVKDPNY